MKKWLWLIAFMFLCACASSKDDVAKYYPELIPEETGHYTLVSIGDNVVWEDLEEKGARNVNPIINRDSVEGFNKSYPQIEVKSAPAYLLFNQDGLALKTTSFEEVVKLLNNEER
ncbi:hypothetical protein [Halobacillus litoralis]|uniref:hypothetical protein n=1 Tax=Halobacillus litoralis TaxID=45668 RepID=UPI0024927436|nr:hypothetical protein [Halobacillus litoralis]